MAEALQRAHVVRDEDDRAAAVAQIVEDVEALLLEGGVADRQHLVDEQDVGIDLDRHRERQPDVHAGRVVLELEVLELLELGELDHALETPPRLLGREAEHDPVHHHVVAGGHVRVEADAELDERRQPTPDPDVALRPVDARQAFEQRALAAPVAPGDPEELAWLHSHRDVVQRLVCVAADPAPRMEGPLLERVHLLLRDSERLAHRPRDHHRQPLAADGWSWHGRESSRDHHRLKPGARARDAPPPTRGSGPHGPQPSAGRRGRRGAARPTAPTRRS